jgi:hypothetical protein
MMQLLWDPWICNRMNSTTVIQLNISHRIVVLHASLWSVVMLCYGAGLFLNEPCYVCPVCDTVML